MTSARPYRHTHAQGAQESNLYIAPTAAAATASSESAEVLVARGMEPTATNGGGGGAASRGEPPLSALASQQAGGIGGGNSGGKTLYLAGVGEALGTDMEVRRVCVCIYGVGWLGGAVSRLEIQSTYLAGQSIDRPIDPSFDPMVRTFSPSIGRWRAQSTISILPAHCSQQKLYGKAGAPADARGFRRLG